MLETKEKSAGDEGKKLSALLTATLKLDLEKWTIFGQVWCLKTAFKGGGGWGDKWKATGTKGTK